MTQHSNEPMTARSRTGEREASLLASPWVGLLSSFQALLKHIGIMLGVTATLALLNLLVDPADFWSRAILVIWLVIVVAHGIGMVIVRLLADETVGSRELPRVEAEPHYAPTSPWAHANLQQQDAAPQPPERADPWKDVAAPPDEPDVSWPQPATATPEPDRPPSELRTSEHADESGWNEKVPWRAATEIAWLRKRRDAEQRPEPKQRDSAS